MRRVPPMLLAFIAIALLCAMDAAIKAGTLGHAVIMVTFLRYLFGMLLSLPLLLVWGSTPLNAELLKGHAVRGLVIASAAYLFFYGLWAIPIAEAVTIAFIAPLLVPPVAALMLGERMRRRNVVACFVGFAGALVAVVGADSGAAGPNHTKGVIACMTSAVLYAFSITLLRQRATRDDGWTISFFAAFFPALFTAPFALAMAPLPEVGELPLFALMGLLGAGGMVLLAFAYARAEAQQLIVLEYTALGWAALFGWLVFGESVRPQVVVGAAVIAAACLWSAWGGRQQVATT